jgi:chromosome segregation ATPase
MVPRYGGMSYDSFDNAVSSLPMPRGPGSDSDEEDMDAGLGLVMDRSKTVSTVSMEITERLEALQRTNEDLSRKCIEAEKTLQRKIEEHELELDETHHRLEELRTELAASNREEKELRSKDVSVIVDIMILC